LLNFAPNSYLERTSRPVYAIVFPDVLNQSQVRVVAFVWLQNLLEYLGSSGKVAWVAPPLAVVIIMAGLQLASRKRWRFRLGDVWPMAIECILLAIPLIVLSMLLNSPTAPRDDIGPSGSGVRRFHQESLLPGSEEIPDEISSEPGRRDS
jgi:hypothetical protein